MATRTEERFTGVISARYASDWHYAAVAVALLVLHAILAWVLRNPGILTAQDDAHYLLLGRSLLDGRYHDIFRVDAPAHTRYPPLYPALLGISELVAGTRFDVLVSINIIASTLALGALFLALKRGWGPLAALVCLTPLAVNSYLLQVAGELRTEALYTLLAMLALLAITRARPEPRTLVAVGAAAIAAALTRSIGVTLVAALGVHWLLERRFGAVAAFGAAAAVTVGAWLVWTALAPEQIAGRHYVADATFGMRSEGPRLLPLILLYRLFGHIPAYFGTTLPYQMAVPNLPGTNLDNIFSALVVTLALAVGVVMFLRRWRLAGLYIVFYGGLLLIWPWRSGRFLTPLLPLLVPAVILGAGALAYRLGERWRMPAMLAFALALTAWGGARTTSWILQERHCERGSVPPAASCVKRDQASFFEAVDYVNRELPPDAVLLTSKPEPMYYYTGRRSAPYDLSIRQSDTTFLPFLRSHGAEYVLLGSLQLGEITRMTRRLEANCRDVALVEEFPPRTYLLRIRHDDEPRGDDGCIAVAASREANIGRNFWRDP